MPTGSFFGEEEQRGSMTGSGPASQPRAPYGGGGQGGSTDSGAGGWRGPSAPVTAQGSGYTTTTEPPLSQRGYGQFPLGQGPSATMPGSIAQYPNAIYNPMASPLGAMVQGLYGPQQEILGNALARQMGALGMVNADVDYKSDALRRDNALALQALGLDRQALGIDRGLVNTQLGNLSRLREILAQQRGLAGEAKTLDATKARDMAKRKTFDLRSDLTARGAFNTVANERGTGRIGRDLMYELQGIDQSYRNTLLGLTEKGIGYDNQQASLQAKLAGIGLDSSRLDISEQQLENALADGLHNIGLGGMTSINQILDAIDSTNSQQAALATQMLQQIIGYSNLPPEVVAQINAMLGAGSAGSGGSSRDERLSGSRVPL